MQNNAQVLEAIEHADHDYPFCPQCSAPTTIVAGDHGELRQVCSATLRTRPGLVGLLARIQAPFHLSRLILSVDEVAGP